MYLLGAILATGLLLAAVLALLHLMFHAPQIPEHGSPRDLGLDYREVRIPTVRGRQLFGWWLPIDPKAPSVVIVHGWGGNAEMMLPLAPPFHSAGMNVLLFDARSHGRSDRDTFASLPRFAEDASRAADWVRTQTPGGRIVLLGHSVGAGAVLYATSLRSDIAAVISIAAFAHPRWMMQRHLRRLHIPGPVSAWILRYVQWLIGHSYDEIAPIHTICHVRCPVLLVHGERDRTVPVSDARTIKAACARASVELFIVPGAGHDSAIKVQDYGDRLIAFLAAHCVI